MTKHIGLYIHIPYCLSKCNYCDFISYAGMGDTEGQYVLSLQKEMEIYAKRYRDVLLDTVYIGGGTPSILHEGGIAKILGEAKNCFRFAKDCEISLEANPKTVTRKKAEEYIEAGVNRFSVGLQSSDDNVLKVAGRRHTYKDFVSTIDILRIAGANNISADIMLGLPEQTVSGVQSCAEAIVSLGINHVSAYGLILEKGTPLFSAVKAGQVVLPDEDSAADMYDAVYQIFERNGICRYEVSNFAKEGFACRHNLNYWHRGEYFGIGVAAHGFFKNRRYKNEKDINKYISKLSLGMTGKISEEKIGIEDAEKEYIMLALRLEEGLDTADFEHHFCVDFFSKYEQVLGRLYNIGLVYFEGRFLKVRKENFRLLNKIILEFF